MGHRNTILGLGLLAALSAGPGRVAQAHEGARHKAPPGRVDAHWKEDFGFAGFKTLDRELQQAWNAYGGAAPSQGAAGASQSPVSGSAANDAFHPPRAIAAAAAVNAPDTTGSWSEVFDSPVVAVQATLLQDGTLLIWDSIGDSPDEQHQAHTFTRAAIWDPASNTFTRIDAHTGYNLFCAGFAHLPNGRILIAGGNKDSEQNGIDTIHIYDPATRTWSLSPLRMGGERWYPSVTPLANGESLITSGRYDTPEVFAPDGSLRALTRAVLKQPFYPWIHAAPDGRAFNFGPDDALRYLDTRGAGGWSRVGPRGDGIERGYGSFGLYDVGRVLAAGGEKSVHSAMVIDFADPNARPVSRRTADMAYGRRQHNLTVLPDGTSLVTGGNSSGAILVDKNAPVYPAELWNPWTGKWTTMASAQRTRQYHSTAILLPDARVFTGGGGICGTCFEAGYLERNYEIYSPPYLFRKDGSGQLATRPSITSVPAGVAYDEAFLVVTPDAARIAGAVMMRVPSVTHSIDFEQRRVPLRYSLEADGAGLRVKAPANANVAPPGYYMLFLLDGSGVPSVAKILFVAPGQGLAAPMLLTAIPSRSGASLSWIGAPGARGYDVWYGASANVLDQRVSTSSTRVSVGRLATGRQYFFAVVARNDTDVSGPSNVLAASTSP